MTETVSPTVSSARLKAFDAAHVRTTMTRGRGCLRLTSGLRVKSESWGESWKEDQHVAVQSTGDPQWFFRMYIDNQFFKLDFKMGYNPGKVL